MNKTTSKSLSRIPKSSSSEHQIKSSLINRLTRTKRFVNLKSEIENVKSMPTIEEESVNELTDSDKRSKDRLQNKLNDSLRDKSNDKNLNEVSKNISNDLSKGNSKDNLKQNLKLSSKVSSKDNLSFCKFKINKESDNKSIDKNLTNKNIMTKKDQKSNIPSLTARSKQPSKLVKGKSKEETIKPVLIRSTRTNLQTPTLSSLNKQNLKQQLTKQVTTKNLTDSNEKNLERENDKIEFNSQLKDTSKDNDSLQDCSESNKDNTILSKSQILENPLKDRDELKDNSLTESVDQQNRIDEQENFNYEHVCRICLDSIQVDGSDLFFADENVSKVSTSNTTDLNDNIKEIKKDEKIELKKELNYISPCDCKGLSKYVHRKCLSEWIYVSKKTNCQVCTVKFRNIKIKVFKKSVMKWLTDEYDHLLMLVLYLIPFLIDCILIFNFLTYDIKLNQNSSKTQLINPSEPVVTNLDRTEFNVDQIDKRLDHLDDLTNSELNNNRLVDQQINESDHLTSDQTELSNWNVFSSFISFKRTKSLARTMSLNMFIYNLYFLEIKMFIKNFSICLSGIPVTLCISLPSLLLFIRYCKSRYEEWQTENLDVSIEN